MILNGIGHINKNSSLAGLRIDKMLRSTICSCCYREKLITKPVTIYDTSQNFTTGAEFRLLGEGFG
jgi:hypothetical protein